MRRKISRDRSLGCASPACGVPIWDDPTGTSLDNDKLLPESLEIAIRPRGSHSTTRIAVLQALLPISNPPPRPSKAQFRHQHQSASVLNTISTFTRREYFIQYDEPHASGEATKAPARQNSRRRSNSPEGDPDEARHPEDRFQPIR